MRTGRPPKYPREDLKRYVMEHPEASFKQIAQAFSGNEHGIKTAFVRHRIRFSDNPQFIKNKPTKYTKAALEAYFAEHPCATYAEAALFFKGSQGGVNSAMKRYGLGKGSGNYYQKLRKKHNNSP